MTAWSASGLAQNACIESSCLSAIQVVSTTKTERSLADVPVRTEVVSAKQVERTHAKDLNEALKYVPGLQLRPIHGKSGYGIWLQGLDANRVLVLVDGHPVSASTGSAVDTTQVAVTDIERIEIIKGAVRRQLLCPLGDNYLGRFESI
jgi:outer membrane receptor for ferrienterochelin and colicins